MPRRATVRAYAQGQAIGPASLAELDTMRRVVADAMRDGAFGVSSALIYLSRSYATTAELIARAQAMAGRGTYITHMGPRRTRASRRWTRRSAATPGRAVRGPGWTPTR